MFVQKSDEFRLEILLPVMLGLVVDVFDRSLDFTDSNRKCAVTFLPFEHAMFGEKSAGSFARWEVSTRFDKPTNSSYY